MLYCFIPKPYLHAPSLENLIVRSPVSRCKVFRCPHYYATVPIDPDSMPTNKKKSKGSAKAKGAAPRSNAANKDDLTGLDDILRCRYVLHVVVCSHEPDGKPTSLCRVNVA